MQRSFLFGGPLSAPAINTRLRFARVFKQPLRRPKACLGMENRLLPLFAILGALALSACQPPPQRVESALEPGYRTDDWRHENRARTLRQSESTRIY